MKAFMHWSRLIAALLLVVSLPACTSYQVMGDPVAGLQAEPMQVKNVRVTLRTGEQFNLKSPHIYGDSLQGASKGSPARSVALADVAAVEVRGTSEIKTAGLVIGSAAVAVWAVIGVMVVTGYFD